MQFCWLFLYNCFTACCWLSITPFRIFTCSCFFLSLHQHTCDFMECLFDVFCCFGTRLYILNFSVILNEGIYILNGDCSTRLQVTFISHQKNLCFRWTWTSDLSVPVFCGILERLLVRDIKYDHKCMCSSIVRTSNRSETLMTSSIPDLQFDLIAVELEGFKAEVDSYGGEKDLTELIIWVSYDYRWFSDAGVAYKNYFEQILILTLILQHLYNKIQKVVVAIIPTSWLKW